MDDRQIIVDNSSNVDGRSTVANTPREIREARAQLRERNNILSQDILNAKQNIDDVETQKAFRELTNELNGFVKQLKEASKAEDEKTKASAEQLKLLLKQSGIYKDIEKSAQKYNTAITHLNKMTDRNTSTLEEMGETLDDLNSVNDELANMQDFVKRLTKDFKEMSEEARETTKNLYLANKEEAKQNSQYRQNQIKRDKQLEKNANQNMGKAFNESLDKVGSTLKGLVDTLNLNKLANIASDFAPTTRQKLQSDLQTTYRLSGSEFDSFKKELYGQINTANYTNEEIMNAMNALNTTALGSTHTATKYFNDIIRGQKALGISAETQKRLLELGNLTGRNELTFYQNQVAKYLNSSLGLNKQQLDQLVSLNANLQTQAADIGIATEEFRQMSMNEGAAFEKTSTGYGSKYTQAISSLLANTDTASALLGMDSGELSERLARGESFTDILRRGQGSRAALNVLANGTTAQQTRYFEHAKNAWGIDQNMWSVLRIIAQNENELSKNLKTATSASQQNGEEAMRKLEEESTDSLTGIQKAVNKIQNYLEQNISWKILSEITNMGTAIITLLSAIKIQSGLKDIFGGLGGKGAGGLVGKLGGLTIGKAGGSAALGALGGILIGTGIGVGDAISMQGSTGHGVVADSLRGFFLGTGSKEKSDAANLGSALGNAGKLAAIGAGIGTFFGPGLGTAIGGLIGGGLGLIGGAFGMSMSDKRKAEQREEERAATLRAIEENTRDTAFNTAKNGVGMVYRYRGTSNYSSMSGIGGIGEAGGFKYSVTSRYGPREPIRTDNGHITSSFHSGTDFGAPEGTPLYSNVSGVVAAVGKDGAGANYVGVTGSDGYTHWYWHLQSAAVVSKGDRVQQGQLVGYAGHTGNAKGSHLHYTVTKPGHTDWWNAESTVDSLPFATQSIFNGGTSTYDPGLDGGTDQLSTSLTTAKSKTLSAKNIGSIAAPIVNSIGDLKQTIIDLSEKTSRNEKIMNALVNRTMESPTI